MRIAIIADIHGNLISLDVVLAEIERHGIERVVCLGDVAGLGAEPREVLERLRDLGRPVAMGHADEFCVDPSLLDPTRHPDADEHTRRLHDMKRWCAAQLGPEDLDYVRTFRPIVEIPLEGGDTLLCYHDSPRSNRDEIRGSTPGATLRAMLGDYLAPATTRTRSPEASRAGLYVVGRGRADDGGRPHPRAVRAPTGGQHRRQPRQRRPALRSGARRAWPQPALGRVRSGRAQRRQAGLDLRRAPVDQAAIRWALLESGMPHADLWAAAWR